MPLIVVEAPAGVNSQVTQPQSKGRWFDSNLIRYRQGALEKMPGWQRLYPDPFKHFIRRMSAWLDLQNRRNLLVGSDKGLELIVEQTRYDLGMPPIPDPRKATWDLDNLGQTGLALQTGGKLQVYKPPDGPITTPPALTAMAEPALNRGMFVAMPQAQVILWGSLGDLDIEDVIDPLMLRWSDAGTYDNYRADVRNQAGSMRLSRGSKIMGAIQAPQMTLIFTDTDCWGMSYVGPPLIYGFTIMGTGCGLVAPHAVVTLGRTTYWQGAKSIWQFGDSGVQPVLSTNHDYMFEDIDVDDLYKCHAGANTISNEVAFYFPSRSQPFRAGTDDTGEVVLSNEPNRYIKYNTVETAWDKGKLLRTAWINNNVFGMPLGADVNFRVQQHERGFDDDDQPMRGVFAETGYAQIGDGTQVLMIDHCQPDFKWFGKNGAVNLTLHTQSYPGSKQRSYGPYSMTETTQFFNPRARAPFMSARFDWAERKGFSARVGATKLRAKPAGRRP